MRTQVCTKCNAEKPESEFYRKSKKCKKPKSACKACTRLARRDRYYKSIGQPTPATTLDRRRKKKPDDTARGAHDPISELETLSDSLFEAFTVRLCKSFGDYLPKYGNYAVPKILESLEIQNPDHVATTKVVLTLRYDKQPRMTSERNLRRLGFHEIIPCIYKHPELIDKGWYVVSDPTQGGFVVRPADILDPDAQYPKVPTISDLFRFCEFIGVDLNPDKINLSTLLLS